MREIHCFTISQPWTKEKKLRLAAHQLSFIHVTIHYFTCTYIVTCYMLLYTAYVWHVQFINISYIWMHICTHVHIYLLYCYAYVTLCMYIVFMYEIAVWKTKVKRIYLTWIPIKRLAVIIGFFLTWNLFSVSQESWFFWILWPRGSWSFKIG